ncbi:TlpA family protein disulfide reductase [Tundrisphaera lichenicola]|uniref:TlpA family protein disulfide reductase n=1 Tax=Tundrisphaera lichenicola TaxID=2029860 RepID=UPI003EBA46EC
MMARVSTIGLIWASILLVSADSASADEPKTVGEIQSVHDKALIGDLVTYLSKNPKADDIDQAYMKIFDKVIEHDWFADNEAVARKYLAEHPEGPVKSLAQIVGTMARAQAGKYQEALAIFDDLMSGLGGAEQEEFAAQFADTLATSALTAGENEVARRVYLSLLRKYGGESPNLAQRIKDEIARIDRVGTSAPSVTVRDLVGATVRLDDYRGKYVLVDFWATWCAPCVIELPRLQAAYAKYQGKGFEIVSVSLDETPTAVLDFVKARKLPWRQVHNATADGDLVEAFGVKNIPATFLIDPGGKIIRLELRGPALDKALETLIR